MIVQPVDEEYLEKSHVCAKCHDYISDGDVVVGLIVNDAFGDDYGHSRTPKDGIHPTVHYKCLPEEVRPVVVSYD